MEDAATNLPGSYYHRGDPLDIPLIDHHVIVHLLYPRITSAIRYAFPEIYLDWTTGVDADADNTPRNAPVIRKRWVEMVLHISLLLGSCHLRRKSVYLETPAMKSLGMILRPANYERQSSCNKLKVYSKIIALVIVTAIVPALYEELKIQRQKQLERQETQLRIAQLHQEFRTTPSIIGQQERQEAIPQQHQQHQGNIVQQRAQKRKTLMQILLVDSILGISDILIPPFRLISYIAYLWGLHSTPNFGNSLIGWEYAQLSGVQASSDDGEPYQRHANFQYGNRRLMVEEGLRTVSAVLPPARNTIAQQDGDNGWRRSVEGTAGSEYNDRSNRNSTQSSQRRFKWIRQRALSFMGVVEEEEEEAEQRLLCVNNSYELKCSLCQTVNPSIPYTASCGHCYCYLCLRMAVTDDLYYRCVRCRKRIDASTRHSDRNNNT